MDPTLIPRIPDDSRSSSQSELNSSIHQITRRTFVQSLGAGLLISVAAGRARAQRRRRGRRTRPQRVAARIHLGQDGSITVLSGKVEMGQGSRGELSQAAAEELRVPVERIQMLMADTGQVPDDGITAGSRTTPSTVPAVRQGTAMARQLLVELACRRWQIAPDQATVDNGRIVHPSSNQSITYAELARDKDVATLFDQVVPADIKLTPVKQWKVMGQSLPLPDRRSFVTGAHKFPSDLAPAGVLYGKVLRPPSYAARLVSVDVGPAKSLSGVTVVRDGEFVGVAAGTTALARQALERLSATAKWQTQDHPSSDELFDYLRQQVRGGMPANPLAAELAAADKVLRQTYTIAYVQHAPLETRTALAEWKEGKLTVWTGTQNPFGYHRELVAAFGLASDQVRVIVPDFGGGFGGKHTGEVAVEAARLARTAGRPVSLKWTREEEFTWAYFRPAAVMDVEASIDTRGMLTSWYHTNINSGSSALESPYRTGRSETRYMRSDPPLRQGSYRVLAATANTFARESFMDELAAAAGRDPLVYRLDHLEDERLRAVLEAAGKRFGWSDKWKQKSPNRGVGLACGTEKGSYVAACVEVVIDPSRREINVQRVCEVFECGAIVNPDNLRSQVQGCIIMGLGPALREQMKFSGGRMRNASFRKYRVPRFDDVPDLDIHLLDRRDIPSAGGGETPIIAIAPAIANAVAHATGKRVRQMPIRLT